MHGDTLNIENARIGIRVTKVLGPREWLAVTLYGKLLSQRLGGMVDVVFPGPVIYMGGVPFDGKAPMLSKPERDRILLEVS